jgi:CysZ protein
MLVALLRALAALPQPPLRRAVILGLLTAVAIFAGLWLGVAALLYDTVAFAWRPLAWAVDLLGGLAVIALTWLLFPAVVTLGMGLFLDRVAAAVEALDYPGQGPPRRQPWSEQLRALLRLTLLTLLLNLLALPVYAALPGINLFLFLGLNGYLLGREYFEVVALRRLDLSSARALRHRFGGRVFLGGVVIAGLFALPLVNLIAPVIATAFMLHVFEGLRRAEPAVAARSAV